ncbi:Thioesterase/thiol ester dehydrase-isomerase [Trichodelitschia bisporula]|uniref:Thioesterase/thiol ester dehydrase-isomerase n=1 Tax=Trichodelitschia bisporula TaxID=703511 RepID=A0A6G1HJS4_9PEZI|nr:Thioesterase/thiol ester dehydrase-isomerase [Trichodelitschia bisporula]
MRNNDAEAHAYFAGIPWCAAALHEPGYVPCATSSRVPKASTEDSFYAETLATPRTLRRCASVHSAPLPQAEVEALGGGLAIREARTLVELGDGVCGFPGIAHGGLVATLLDEEMGILLTVNADRAEEMSYMTAYLNVRYMGPVRVPGIVCARARVVRCEGRKMFVEGEVVDRDGVKLATAECLFVRARGDPRL